MAKRAGFLAAIEVFTFFLAAGAAPGNATGDERASDPGKKFFRQLVNDTAEVLSAPFHWQEKDWSLAVTVAGSGGFFFLTDAPVRDWALDNQTTFTSDASAAVSHAADSLSILGAVAGIYAVGKISGRENINKTALECLESVGISMLLMTSFKTAFGRARPYAGEGSFNFHPFSFKSRYEALPSGHSTISWAFATTIAKNSPSLAVDIVAYSFSTLVSLSRITLDKHWASDSFFGAVLGYAVASKIVSLHRRKNTAGAGKKANFDCALGFTGNGIRITVSWPSQAR